MPDGKYMVSAWIGDIPLSATGNEYKKLGTIKGIYPLDLIEVTVKGSMHDDQNVVVGNSELIIAYKYGFLDSYNKSVYNKGVK